MRVAAAVCLWCAAAVCLEGSAGRCATEWGLAELERLVAVAPEDRELRLRLAAAYEERGLLEAAVAEHLAMLARQPEDEEARRRAEELVEERMPRWLPEAAEQVAPFKRTALQLELERAGQETRFPRLRSGQACPTEPTRDGGVGRPRPTNAGGAQESRPTNAGGAQESRPIGQGAKKVSYRLLVTEEGFAAREGERWDEVHQRGLPWVDYGYVWEAGQGRWVMKVRVHWRDVEDGELAREALRATLAFYCVAREYLGCDPTAGGKLVDVWLGTRGRPGARAVGGSVYLYSVGTPRAPAEWVRQVAHEYGHVALPGIGGFTETDDPWADGHLGELLFPKWLVGSGVPEWMPWSVEEWEAEAREERARLMGIWPREELGGLLWQEASSCRTQEQWQEASSCRTQEQWQEQAPAERGSWGGRRQAPAEHALSGRAEEARDCFLGLALHVEEAAGPRFLGEVLRRCPRGTATEFAAAVERLAEERGMEVWWAR